MSDSDISRRPGEIIYHFDVQRSSIPLAQFIETGRATQEIIDDFNQALFDGKTKYELHVKTPEPGSLIDVLLVTVTIGGSILAFLGTDIGKAFFKGLTGDEPAAWSEKLGSAIRAALTKPVLAAEADATDQMADGESLIDQSRLDSEIEKRIAAEAIAYLLIRFLEADSEQLRKIGITPEKFRAAFQGRNRIFKGCIDNPEVLGITFGRSPEFTLRRSDFPRKIAQIPDLPVEEPPRPTDWNVETVDIVVNSPNWKRDGRKWQAATRKYQDIAFSVEDDRFWFFVDRKDIQPDIRDNMRVQWAYPAGIAKPASVRVLRVISYNGKPISPPMNDEELKQLFADVHFVEPDPPDLFDERRGPTDDDFKGDA